MTRKSILPLTVFSLVIFTCMAQANVLAVKDSVKNCTSYQVVDKGTNEGLVLFNKLQEQGAKIVSQKSTYGLSLQNLRIDFDNKLVKMDIEQRIAMGFNRILVKDVIVTSQDANLNKYINSINFDLQLMQEVCIGAGNKLVRAE